MGFFMNGKKGLWIGNRFTKSEYFCFNVCCDICYKRHQNRQILMLKIFNSIFSLKREFKGIKLKTKTNTF
uniref:Uncharacterized protein n=1 Tax=Pleurostomum flabellatum TaxID=405751 RepID=A0A7T0M441_9EUKA|nr:hypothetical protein J6731_mgp15 [Pleurostomum flabellatum]QPL15635.1 hypothetical protein [Pleurostomum flabellatum]